MLFEWLWRKREQRILEKNKHAIERFKERYGVTLRADEILLLNKYAHRFARVVNQQSNTRAIIQFYFNHILVEGVYSTKTKMFYTFLPQVNHYKHENLKHKPFEKLRELTGQNSLRKT